MKRLYIFMIVSLMLSISLICNLAMYKHLHEEYVKIEEECTYGNVTYSYYNVTTKEVTYEDSGIPLYQEDKKTCLSIKD